MSLGFGLKVSDKTFNAGKEDEMAERKDIMLAYAFDHKRLNRYPKPWLVQPKIEGDRCRAVFDKDGHVQLLSSGCKDRNFAVPHIVQQLEMMGLYEKELDGELYIHGMPHPEIRSMVSRTAWRHSEHEKIQYHIFDLVDESLEQIERSLYVDYFKGNVEKLPNIKLVHTYPIRSSQELNYKYGHCLGWGYEGIIIRRPDLLYIRKQTTGMMKLKPNLSDIYVVTDSVEEKDKYGKLKGTLGALWCKGPECEPFKVGSGFTHQQRFDLWQIRDSLPGRFVKVRYQALNPSGKPQFGRFVEFVNLD